MLRDLTVAYSVPYYDIVIEETLPIRDKECRQVDKYFFNFTVVPVHFLVQRLGKVRGRQGHREIEKKQLIIKLS